MSDGLHWSEGEYAAWLRRHQDLRRDTSAVRPRSEAPDISEGDFEGQVIAYAKRHGWRIYHVHDSRACDWRSDDGYPDWTLVGTSGLLFVELKTRTGKVSKDQTLWLKLLQHAGQECYVWRPADWPTIEARLAKG